MSKKTVKYTEGEIGKVKVVKDFLPPPEVAQTTFQEIIDSEHLLLSKASEKYGDYYGHALRTSAFLTKFMKSIDPGYDTVAAFLSYTKKHHLLAIFSTVRLHKVQAMMNLRQTLEGGVNAAFAIAHPDPSHFVHSNKYGLLSAPKELTNKRYRWIEQNFSGSSQSITDVKKQINESMAHANLIYAQNNFRLMPFARQYDAPFFDFEDDYFVRTDLWLAGKVVIVIVDLLFGVNQSVGAIKLVDDFAQQFERLLNEDRALHAEITATERFKKAHDAAFKMQNG